MSRLSDVFGHIAIEPKKKSSGDTFWSLLPREGFTAACAERLNAAVPLDDVSDREAQAIVQRGDLLAALEGVKQGKSNGAIRRAVTL
jgi:hypothetical protein